jgi:voltage-gated potassium channel
MNTAVTHRNSFIFFTVTLVALLVVSALGHLLPGGVGKLFPRLLTLTLFAVAYHTLTFGPRWHPFVATIFLLSLATNLIDTYGSWPAIELCNRVLGLVFFSGVAVNCSRQVLLSSEVRTNTIVGALAIYLLLGLIWASLYSITVYFIPGALHGIEPVGDSPTFPRLLYFSYITLATVGYGDIQPAVPVSQTLAYLEAITGTFYLAIVVASLISARRDRST